MKIEYLVDENYEPTKVVLAIEDWKELVRKYKVLGENTEDDISVPLSTQDEMERRSKNVQLSDCYTVDEMRAKIKF